MEDIDLYVGMTLERPSQNGALVGDTFLCLIGDQFARLKWGDRYFYDLRNQPGSFNLSKYIAERRRALVDLVQKIYLCNQYLIVISNMYIYLFIFSENLLYYLAHVIEQPNFRIPNPQYFVYLLDQTVERENLQFIY